MAAATLDSLTPGTLVTGLVPGRTVEVVAVTWHGSAALTLTHRDDRGQVAERLVYRSDEGSFAVAEGGRRWAFDGDGAEFRLVAEARRISMAHLFDPMLAITTSAIDPLPHQIEAVYGEMLPRLPLRFLLADDPGAGKTIMAGLYLKELILRGDATRVLVVAPGGLVSQWQDELAEKFGLGFDIVTRDDLDAVAAKDVFAESDHLIARVDQLARRDDIVARLTQADWDVVVVDEAHRMSAHFDGGEVSETRRYQLGKVLGQTTRHLLLMTATPHSGKEEDFQLFLALLDPDRFEGRFRGGVHTVDTSDVMRRMVKERLLRFDGTPLFPERRATTVTYPLSAEETGLYEAVTDYVRTEMGRADRLAREGQGQRGNTVGFALTILQRRLASSPEAIYQSLRRRRQRLRERVAEERRTARRGRLSDDRGFEPLSGLLSGDGDGVDGVDPEDLDELDDAERESLEAEVVDQASTARTVAELEAEIEVLGDLEARARRVRAQGDDRKWSELSRLITSAPEMTDARGRRRKLIIFTEHRDTLNYLVDRLRTLLGAQAVVHISGGTPRDGRRAIQQRFTQEPECLVLVATDAAGEGINLQRAHLVVNYDLPWNPNRIEQRFGRVHRIGQTEVCHMWNLVAEDTREAQVYLRLLDKVAEQAKAYRGQVFDVLGQALSGRDLRDLLLEAIRYGDQPEVRSRLDRVIDEKVGRDLPRLIDEQALSTEVMALADVSRIRRRMEEAEAARLQPHYIRSFFLAAFEHLGGRWREREPERFELTHVPVAVRDRSRTRGGGSPVLARYERITFDREAVRSGDGPLADLVAPGHPLLGAVIDLVIERRGDLLTRGAVLVDDDVAHQGGGPRLLLLLEHAITDARPSRDAPHTVVSRRFEFVEVPTGGSPVPGGPAPYLDHRPATETEADRALGLIGTDWPGEDVETLGRHHAIGAAVPDHLAVVRAHTDDRVTRTRTAVRERLTQEINHWDSRAAELREQADAGRQPRMNPDRAQRRADELAQRLRDRLITLDQEATLSPLPPVVVGAALVVPRSAVSDGEVDSEEEGLVGEAPEPPPDGPRSTAEVERRAIEAVLDAEAELGHQPEDVNETRPNNPGYDIASLGADGHWRFIEVKGRIAGARSVTISRTEILTGLNSPDHFILALVEVGTDGTEQVHYLRRPFAEDREPGFTVTSVNHDWGRLWSMGEPPS